MKHLLRYIGQFLANYYLELLGAAIFALAVKFYLRGQYLICDWWGLSKGVCVGTPGAFWGLFGTFALVGLVVGYYFLSKWILLALVLALGITQVIASPEIITLSIPHAEILVQVVVALLGVGFGLAVGAVWCRLLPQAYGATLKDMWNKVAERLKQFRS